MQKKKVCKKVVQESCNHNICNRKYPIISEEELLKKIKVKTSYNIVYNHKILRKKKCYNFNKLLD